MVPLYLWGCSIQEIGCYVVIGRSIYGVVVVDGSLYSDSTVIVKVLHNEVCQIVSVEG